jgi:hypothetical protein
VKYCDRLFPTCRKVDTIMERKRNGCNENSLRENVLFLSYNLVPKCASWNLSEKE